MVNARSGDLRSIAIHLGALAMLASMSPITGYAQGRGDSLSALDSGLFRHIQTRDPATPHGPLRQDNITDQEVSEIQQAALEVYPDFIVNISGVTDGCDCEEGSQCTAQVWLALYRQDRTRGLVLSKIDGHWQIGKVQKWWLQYSEHQTSNPGFGWTPKQTAWAKENQHLLDEFPACPVPRARWTPVTSRFGNSKYVDMSSMQVSGSIRRVNFKYESTLPRTPPDTRFRWHDSLFTIRHFAFNCEDHRQRIDFQDFYYSDGTADANPGPMPPLIWDPVQPNTEAADDLNLVCGAKLD